MPTELEHADVTPDGLVLYFSDGREALIDTDRLLALAEQSHGFLNTGRFQAQRRAKPAAVSPA